MPADGEMEELQMKKMGKSEQEFLNSALSKGPNRRVFNIDYFELLARQEETW